ncbi:MAG: PrsW family glutamic-type intramembrane protease [Desulfobacteraceae bacterium]|jgi:RsiW-degrading membrane proteinase PrsW (M82 family)
MSPIALGAALVPSAVLMWFFHSRDLHPEPARVLWATFFLGIAAIVPISIVAGYLDSAVDFIHADNIYLQGTLTAFFVAAVPEEFFKYVILLRYSMRHDQFDEPMDGIVYGVAASLGFATLENILYVAGGGMNVAFSRAVTAVPAHAMMGAIMGYFAGQALFRPEKARRFNRLALGCAVMLHGLYDAPLIIISNAIKSGIELPGYTHGILIILFAAVLLTHFVWAMWLVIRLRSQQRNELKAQLSKQWQRIWFRIMFGIVLGAGAVMVLCFWIVLLLENDGTSINQQINPFVLLTAALSGVSGGILLRSGLKAKKEFDASFKRDLNSGL